MVALAVVAARNGSRKNRENVVARMGNSSSPGCLHFMSTLLKTGVRKKGIMERPGFFFLLHVTFRGGLFGAGCKSVGGGGRDLGSVRVNGTNENIETTTFAVPSGPATAPSLYSESATPTNRATLTPKTSSSACESGHTPSLLSTCDGVRPDALADNEVFGVNVARLINVAGAESRPGAVAGPEATVNVVVISVFIHAIHPYTSIGHDHRRQHFCNPHQKGHLEGDREGGRKSRVFPREYLQQFSFPYHHVLSLPPCPFLKVLCRKEHSQSEKQEKTDVHLLVVEDSGAAGNSLSDSAHQSRGTWSTAIELVAYSGGEAWFGGGRRSDGELQKHVASRYNVDEDGIQQLNGRTDKSQTQKSERTLGSASLEREEGSSSTYTSTKM